MTGLTQTYKADGDVVSTNADLHWERMQQHLENAKAEQTLELDLRAASMVDSVGLNAIVKAIKIAEKKEVKIRLLIASESLKRICTFTRLDQKAEIVGP